VWRAERAVGLSRRLGRAGERAGAVARNAACHPLHAIATQHEHEASPADPPHNSPRGDGREAVLSSAEWTCSQGYPGAGRVDRHDLEWHRTGGTAMQAGGSVAKCLVFGQTVVEPRSMWQPVITIAQNLVQKPFGVHMSQVVPQVGTDFGADEERAVHNGARVVVGALRHSSLQPMYRATECGVRRIHAHGEHAATHAEIALERRANRRNPSRDLLRACDRDAQTRGDPHSRRPGDPVRALSCARGTAAEKQTEYSNGRARRLMPAVLLALAATVLLGAAVAHADGPRPGQPYHYLHPPKYLRDINQLPEPTTRTYHLHSLSGGLWFAFTHDGQAGLSASIQPFAAAASITSVHIHVDAINTPGALPDTLYADGNAYRIRAIGDPGRVNLALRRAVTLTLRFPRLPAGIETYRNGAWQSLCTLRQSLYTSATIACHTRTLGIFLAVYRGPPRPRHTSQSWISRWGLIAAGAALIVLVLVVISAGAVRRGRRQPAS
jgi:hypothetical protein